MAGNPQLVLSQKQKGICKAGCTGCEDTKRYLNNYKCRTLMQMLDKAERRLV